MHEKEKLWKESDSMFAGPKEPVSVQVARAWYYVAMFVSTGCVALSFVGGLYREDELAARVLVGVYFAVMACLFVLPRMIKRQRRAALWAVWVPVGLIVAFTVAFHMAVLVLLLGFLPPALMVCSSSDSPWWK